MRVPALRRFGTASVLRTQPRKRADQEYHQAVTVQIPPRLERLPLGRGQKVLLVVSVGLLLASAGGLWRYVPQLPARIPTHWSGAGAPDGFGPPSTLWALWALMLGMWLMTGLLAWKVSGGTLPLKGLPPLTPQNAPRILGELRTAFLVFQCIVMLIFSGVIGATLVVSLGGPNLIVLPLLLTALVPLGIGSMLYRVSYVAQR
jgi:hypothetical protein